MKFILVDSLYLKCMKGFLRKKKHEVHFVGVSEVRRMEDPKLNHACVCILLYCLKVIVMLFTWKIASLVLVSVQQVFLTFGM